MKFIIHPHPSLSLNAMLLKNITTINFKLLFLILQFKNLAAKVAGYFLFTFVSWMQTTVKLISVAWV